VRRVDKWRGDSEKVVCLIEQLLSRYMVSKVSDNGLIIVKRGFGWSMKVGDVLACHLFIYCRHTKSNPNVINMRLLLTSRSC